jgi:hypothetical protein
VTHGFVSWARGPVAARLPVRRSTVLLVVVFVGLVVLYFSVRTEKIDYRGELFDVTEETTASGPAVRPLEGYATWSSQGAQSPSTSRIWIRSRLA